MTFVRSHQATCGSLVTVQVCQLILVQQSSASTLPTDSRPMRSHARVPTQPSPEIRAYHRVLSWAPSSDRRSATKQCSHSVTRCSLHVSPSLLVLYSPLMNQCSSCQELNSSTVPQVSFSVAPVSTNSPIPTVVCFFLFYTSGAGLIQHMSNHRVVECGISGIPVLHICSAVVETDAETGVVPTSAQFLAVRTLLILRSPSCTRSCTLKSIGYQCASVVVLLPTDQSTIHRRTVTFDLYFHWNSQISVHRSQRYPPFTTA